MTIARFTSLVVCGLYWSAILMGFAILTGAV